MRLILPGLLALGACDPDPCALDRPVSSIDDAIALVDALPEPTLTCFVRALPRPLEVELSSNPFSLQPPPSRTSPRVFVTDGPLVMSIVVAGEARDFLEFGELLDDGRSLKAEIAFPVSPGLSRADAFTRTWHPPELGGTSCGVCHEGEIEVTPGEFASAPLRPDPSRVVPLSLLREEHALCDPREDAERCAMLDAIFDPGPVVHRPLPEAFAF